jgi:Beta propeller domain
MRRLILILFANLVITGCGGGDDQSNDQPEVSGMLRKVRSAAELENSLKTSITQVAGISQPLPTVTTGGASGDFSSTYTAEEGVDEFDFARYDGNYLFVAPTSSSNSQLTREIRVLKTEPVAGTATQVSSIPLDSNQVVQGIYVADGRLVLVTSQAYYPSFGEVWSIMIWQPTKSEILVYDVSDPAHPASLSRAELDGAFVASRRVGDRVYLVTRHSPPVPTDFAGHPELANLSLDDLLPKVFIAGRVQPLFAPLDCYITNDGGFQGYPSLTTITSFSMQSPATLVSTCYDEAANGVYASTSALYISQPRSGLTSSALNATRIHKFSLTGAAPTYAGSVEVPGLLWMGGQQDFRINEYQGMLRVMTTEFTDDPLDRQDHQLFVLRPKTNELALEVVSKLPNAARPEEIGKRNEGLFGVRFIGDRAYAITFRQMDPMYVLDLANAADPRIAGSLEIPGFSTFLHPVTEDLLLGVGSDVSNAKVELFDVTHIEHPQSRGSVVIDGWASYFEAQWERHAFTYLPADAVDRFAIPGSVYPVQSPGVYVPPQTSLYLFEILGKQNAGSASLQAAGVVAPPTASESEIYDSSSRSFIHGDTVYYVRNGKVWSSPWFAPSQLQGPF